MTTLVVEELKTTALEQVIYIEKRMTLNVARLHLYRQENPPGSLKLSVYSGAVLLGESIVPIANFFSEGAQTPLGYFHGMVKFEFINGIHLGGPGNFKFKLEGIDGYTVGLKQIAWVKEYERRIAPMVENPIDWTHSPYGIELIDLSEISSER